MTDSTPPVVLSVAGSDCSGGAGIQADLKAVAAQGGYAATVITAITVQNTRGVRRIAPLAPSLVREQLEAVLDDLPVKAIKTGMLATGAIVRELREALEGRPDLAVVVDPVVRASDGTALLDEPGVEELKTQLLPRATVATPNVHELSLLTGRHVADLDSAEEAARCLIETTGVPAVLVTGGHLERTPGVDLLVDESGSARFPGEFVHGAPAHGGGCAYAAAIACRLAGGDRLVDAVRGARSWIEGAVGHGLRIGGGNGPVDPFHLRTRAETGQAENH
jgi:hydroxymethylpyrimidine/phosphomethylpyrimidine kinase